MKKITLFFALVISSLGFSQTYDLLESFNGTGLEGVFGGTAAVYATDPTGTDQVVEVTSSSTGQIWQGVNVTLTKNYQLTTATQLTMQLDVYSLTAITIAPKAQGGIAGAPNAVTSANHNGTGWETLTFEFNVTLDGQGPANGEYNDFALHINWDTAANTFGAPDSRMFYIKNLRGLEVTATQIPTPTMAAPIPSNPDNTVYSIYNDTNNYTNVFPVQYDFGVNSGMPDLDPSAAVNTALQMDFAVAGWGQGEALENVSSYGFFSFNYWASTGTPGFNVELIANTAGTVSGTIYEYGGANATIVEESWQTVSIPLTEFTTLGFDAANFFQWKVDPYQQSVNNGGIVYFDNIMFTQTPLSNNNIESNEFSVYPNPTTNRWNVSAVNTSIDSIQVYDMTGKLVVSKTVGNSDATIDASALTSGLYVARIVSGDAVQTVKLVKK
ncbi:T9SS type A sorting domain-containing protein [Nonlabens sp.]|uniref:T9SS type A sorting domain-containing protein n=1 Tax=Nonlabens sp. TaxID=1888209 RepID=UPI003F696791